MVTSPIGQAIFSHVFPIPPPLEEVLTRGREREWGVIINKPSNGPYGRIKRIEVEPKHECVREVEKHEESIVTSEYSCLIEVETSYLHPLNDQKPSCRQGLQHVISDGNMIEPSYSVCLLITSYLPATSPAIQLHTQFICQASLARDIGQQTC